MSDRLYHFHFDGIKEPITVKAPDRITARKILIHQKLPPQYAKSQLLGETTSNLIVGVSYQMIGDKKAYWDGKKFSVNAQKQ